MLLLAFLLSFLFIVVFKTRFYKFQIFLFLVYEITLRAALQR
jgi:hypothetical protein